jgi:hypothetical protein
MGVLKGPAARTNFLFPGALERRRVSFVATSHGTIFGAFENLRRRVQQLLYLAGCLDERNCDMALKTTLRPPKTNISFQRPHTSRHLSVKGV